MSVFKLPDFVNPFEVVDSVSKPQLSNLNELPYSKVVNNRPGVIKRNIITWFVPEYGTIQMYVNPKLITISEAKTIKEVRTKNGFTIQYWGEELSKMTLTGTTGSSGIEGINMLYEIYRADQLAFNAIGLSIDANNANNNPISSLIDSKLNDLAQTGKSGAIGAGILSTISNIAGIGSNNSLNLSQRDIMSLSQLATGVEMYYNGIIYRGYFKTFSFNEKADDFLLDYTITFSITQKRGYRTNYLPFHRTPNNGPSDNTLHSFNPNGIAGSNY